MDAKQFYTVKFEILSDLALKLAEAKQIMARLAEHEDRQAACPDMSELEVIQADLDRAEETVDIFLDAVRPLI